MLVSMLILAMFPRGVMASLRGETVEGTLKLAAKASGREIAGTSAEKSLGKSLARLTSVYGDDVLIAVEDGGLELLEAATKYGDDVMEIALKSTPQARRILAMNADALVPLARRVGPEVLELEAKAPGLSAKVFQLFGDDAGKVVAKSVTTDDLPRFYRYGELADSPATRKLWLKAYQLEGRTIFERIPAKLVLATGLTTAMILGASNLTDPPGKAIAEVLANNAGIVESTLNFSIIIGATVFFLVMVLLLWRFGLMPWHRKKKASVLHLQTEGEETETSAILQKDN